MKIRAGGRPEIRAGHILGLAFVLGVLSHASAADAQPTSQDDPPEISVANNPSRGAGAGNHSGAFMALDPFHAGLGMGSGYGWLRQRTVDSELVRKGGGTLDVWVNFEFFDLISVAGSAGTIFVGDNAGFSEAVVDQTGNHFVAHSDFGINIFRLSGGLRTPEYALLVNPANGGWAGLYGFARYGYADISGGRAIANCVDCTSQDVPLSSGSFFESGVDLGLKAGDGFGLSINGAYRYYFAGAAIAGEVQLGFTFWYW